MENICIVIPARYKSSRLPEKLLLKIGDKTIIRRTYEQAKKSKLACEVFVTTDEEKIKEEIEKIGGKVIMVKEECLNGTERVYKALKEINDKYKYIVNVQGDEPFIDPENIDYMIEKHMENKEDEKLGCTTLHFVLNRNDIRDLSIGKMVMDKNNNVMYCSRNFIPGTKNGEPKEGIEYFGHIGLFIFNREYLEKYFKEDNTRCQLSEDIEWLKIIEMGYKIKSYVGKKYSERGLNTLEDYLYLKNKYS